MEENAAIKYFAVYIMGGKMVVAVPLCIFFEKKGAVAASVAFNPDRVGSVDCFRLAGQRKHFKDFFC